jgi:hypothetical protein
MRATYRIWLEPSAERLQLFAELSEWATSEHAPELAVEPRPESYQRRLALIRQSLDEAGVEYSVEFGVEEGRDYAIVQTVS